MKEGMQNQENDLKGDYELSFLLKTAEDAAGVFNILKKYKAEFYYESPIKRINLMYKIKKQTSAFFGFCQFYCLLDDIVKIKDELKMISSVIRFLIITSPFKLESNQIKARPQDTTKPSQPSSGRAVTNEALEKELEEILK